jgi:phosphoribosylformimino-5-aminoimidazole carboxamide ribotide isomerase
VELFAAIDLRHGAAVRLSQGDYEREQDYGDPVALADRFIDDGAPWLHVVDLDAARSGAPTHQEVVESIVARAARTGVSVELGGGIRRAEQVELLLALGVRRVVLGTALLEDPGMARGVAEEHPGAVAAGLDYRARDDGTLEPATRGWTRGSGRTLEETLALLAGAPFGAVVVTSIERDGMLSGPDLAGLRATLDMTELPVVASGGVGSRSDLALLAQLRSSRHFRALAGVVVGRALVDGRLDVKEALAACRPFA